MRYLVAACLLLALIGGVAAQEPSSQVQVTDTGLKKGDQPEAGFAGLDAMSQGFSFGNGVQHYVINYHAYWDPKSELTKVDPEGWLGMPVPAGCNWYAGGFMDINFNGLNLGATRPTSLRVVESGERGLAEIMWRTADGQVRLRFLQEAGTDYLGCEIAVVPAKEVRNLDLSLRCYPSYFTAWNHKDGWRQVIGLATTVEQGQTLAVDPVANPWLLYQDRVFDVAKNPQDSAGPCAVLYLPEQIKSVKALVTDYPVTTSISVKPEVRSVRLAFWEFPHKTNADALERMKSGGAEVATHLRQVDFGNRQVATFDATRERATLDALIAKSSTPDKWREKLVPQLEQVGKAVEAFRNHDLTAELPAAEGLAKYRDIIWDLKFDALLSD